MKEPPGIVLSVYSNSENAMERGARLVPGFGAFGGWAKAPAEARSASSPGLSLLLR